MDRSDQGDKTEVIPEFSTTVAKLELGCAVWPDITLSPAFAEVSV